MSYLRGCAPVCECVPQYGRVCPCMCVCEVWVSLSHVIMMDTQVHLCVHLITWRHVTKAYMAKTSWNQLLLIDWLIPLCKCSLIRQLAQHSNQPLYNNTYSVGCSAHDVTMLTSTSYTTGGVLCTTLAHIHKSMESHYTYMRTHNLPVTARCWLTFDVIIGIEGVTKCESSVWICALPHFCICVKCTRIYRYYW